MKVLLTSRRRRSGMATIVVIVIISLLLIYVMGNARHLHQLGRELRLIEERQKRRIASPAPVAAPVLPAVPAAASQP